MNAYDDGTFRRISKREAIKRFNEGKAFAICPCKMRPGPPWNPDCPIGEHSINEWKRHAEFYSPTGITPSDTMWEGDVNKTAWSLFYNNWSSYNTNHEQGHYASYYLTKEMDLE